MTTLQGQLYWRGDDGYEQERVGRVFNGRKPDRYPVAILKAAHEEDVIAGVRLARERGLKVSVRSGGHSWAAWSVRDDALLIDLAGMREISLDTDTLTVRVSPAVTGDELNSLLAEHGLMFPGGHCPTVGLGGFLLQGGMGWNCRGWGWACESIEAIDVVTADGRLVRADESQNAELWLLRRRDPLPPQGSPDSEGDNAEYIHLSQGVFRRGHALDLRDPSYARADCRGRPSRRNSPTSA